MRIKPCSSNLLLLLLNVFEQILQLSLILPKTELPKLNIQNSQNWLVSNELQEHIKHETNKILTQKKG